MRARLNEITNWVGLAKECGFKAGMLARKAGVSLRTLERHWILKFQQTPTEFLNGLKMQEISEQAREGRYGKQIIESVGLSHCSCLSRFLKKTAKRTLRAVKKTEKRSVAKC